MPINKNDQRIANVLTRTLQENNLPRELISVDEESNGSHMWYLLNVNEDVVFYSGFLHDVRTWLNGYLYGNKSAFLTN